MNSTPTSKISVLYLYRYGEPEESIKKFKNSYLKYNAGISHDLVILFKGFYKKTHLTKAQNIFSNIKHKSLELPDKGYDQGSYYEAAQKLDSDFIFCLNTFSEILADNWLKNFYQYAALPNVGIVGATGSYESLTDSMTLIQKNFWLLTQNDLEKSTQEGIKTYFSSLYSSQKTKTLKGLIKFYLSKTKYIKKILRFFMKKISNPKDTHLPIELRYARWWKKTKTLGDIPFFLKFPIFPNPHIRSNAFMIKRNLFLSLKRPSFSTKFEACHFESGHDGMCRQLHRSNLKTLIVGKNGEAYDVPDWPLSGTFRTNSQNNLLIADNQTSFYLNASKPTQTLYTYFSWGDEIFKLPEDFPNLNYKLRKTKKHSLK